MEECGITFAMPKEMKYYGVHACLAIAEKRPEDIIRVYLDESSLKTFSPLLKWCAKARKAYHIIPPIELDKVSDSIHHEGVCILAKERPSLSSEIFQKNLPHQACLLYLDGIENPHNLGSILRTAAHFGIPYILGETLQLTPSACRIAKGAAEIVRLVSLNRPRETLAKLEAQGFAVIAASAHQGESLYRFAFPPRTIIAMGSESTGLKSPFLKKARAICIPGTGAIESLNVAVATALCIGEYRSQYGQ
jgi:RNA methyltransferase, TrmH family